MMQLDFYKYHLLPDDYVLINEALWNMAINAPDFCYELLNKLPDQKEYGEFSHDTIFKDDIYDCVILSPRRVFCSSYGSRTPSWEEDVDFFVECCNYSRLTGDYVKKDSVVKILRRFYSHNAAQAIAFLLSRVSNETLYQFYMSFMDPDELAHRASVDIIVRPIANEKDMHGNTGRYLIHTFKEGSVEQQLHFTNQPSCVYYLMYLIDRCHHEEPSMSSIDLANNLDSFVKLYHKVYDITSDALNERVRRLLYREDAAGMLRVGRERECINDIRKHLEEAFTSYGESYFPYAMTANRHLSVSPQKIIFEGKASELLSLEFA